MRASLIGTMRPLMSETDAWQDWFERAWKHREEEVYPALFGATKTGIYTIPWDRLEAGQITDPRWAHCGVFKFAPTTGRGSWLYVSSGLSNAWFDERPDPADVSGFGCEFVVETTDDADWPVQRLHQLMVYHIGLCVGRYPGHQPLAEFHRIPLGCPLDWQQRRLTHLMLAEPTGYPRTMSLESGRAD